MPVTAAWIADPNFRRGVVLSVGAARSGKTTLGQLMASFEHVDHLDEYWPLMSGAAALAQGIYDENAFALSANAAIAEVRNDNMLLRTANFRPRDESSVWQTTRLREIVYRLVLLRTRESSAERIADGRQLLVLGATDCIHRLQAFARSFSWSDILIVVRHPLDVALGASRRGWFSDKALEVPDQNMPTSLVSTEGLLGRQLSSAATLYLPWWLRQEDYLAFVEGDELFRGLMYWKALHIDNAQLADAESLGLTVVRFDDIIERPLEVVRQLPFMEGRVETPRTRRLVRKIVPPPRQSVKPSAGSRELLARLAPHVESLELGSSIEIVS